MAKFLVISEYQDPHPDPHIALRYMENKWPLDFFLVIRRWEAVEK